MTFKLRYNKLVTENPLRQIHGLSEFHASYQPALDSLVLSRENPALLFIKIQNDGGRLSSID